MSDDQGQHQPEETPETVKVARDLREIERMDETLDDQAEHRHSHRLMPGGRAMVMLAHTASVEAVAHTQETAERLWWESPLTTHEDRPDMSHLGDTWEPPLQSLLFWSEQWREERGALTDRRPTVASEAGFLRESVDWAWDNELRWADFRADVKAARLRLEDELTAGNRAERTQTPCLNDECGGRRLIKVHQAKVAWDFYKCTACKRRYDHKQYVQAQSQALALTGTEKFVRIQDAIGALRSQRGERTIRKWFEDCLVHAYCDTATRQVWCWWPDVRRLHVETPTRNRKRVTTSL